MVVGFRGAIASKLYKLYKRVRYSRYQKHPKTKFETEEALLFVGVVTVLFQGNPY